MLNIRKRFFLLLTFIGALLCFVSCTTTKDTFAVSFDQKVYEIKVGQTLDITPIIDNGSNVDITKYEYTTNDSNVATFVDGKLTGVQQGETMIKIVCTANQKKDGSSVTVYDIAKVIVVANNLPDVVFTEPQKAMVKGTEQTLQYSFVPTYGTANMTFTSANTDVATVDENGVISAVGVGTAVIVVRATDIEIPSQYQDYTFIIEVIEADFMITYELNGGVNNPENPAGYNTLALPLEVLAPTKAAYKFLGWYDNAEFEGEALTAIAAGTRGDVTLYAKWELVEYTINYDLDGGVNNEANPAFYNIEKLPLVLAEPTKNGYNFAGWYMGENEVTEIVEGTTGEVTLTAKWELATYTITYNLNGGAWQDLEGKVYPFNMNRDEMVREFVVDFNTFGKKTVAADGSDFFARSWVGSGSLGYDFLTSSEYGEKWKWMLNYLNHNRVLNGKAPLTATDNQAEARGEIHNFLNSCAPDENSDNKGFGSDYSSADIANGFWVYTLYLPEIEVVNEYTMLSDDIVLPVVYRSGYKFAGWQNGNEVITKIAKGSYGNLNLTAKWDVVEYEIDFKVNGGKWESQADFTVSTLKGEFTIKNYLTYQSQTGADVALMNKTGSLWWGYIALKETAVNGLYEIIEVVSSRDKLTVTADMYITWHDGCTDAAAKAFLDGMVNANGEYLGQYIYVENIPADGNATKEALISAKVYTKDGVVITGEPNNKYTIEQEFVLPEPSKNGYEFLGWFNGTTKVEKIPVGSMGNMTLVAEWYNADEVLNINYQLNGGKLSSEDPKTFIAKDGLETLPTPTNPGYKFLGWFTDEECTNAITLIETGRNKGITIYASWELLTFKLEYEMNGGVFLSDAIAPKYDSFELLVEDFLNDYATMYSLTDVTATTFYGKTSKYGVYSFFKNEEMAEKWTWLLEFMYAEAVKANYAGKVSMQLNATAANFNKYMRTNLAALFQETRLTNVTPATMDYTNVDGEALWAACPTKVIQVGIEAKYEYTALDLPLEIATPNRADGVEFVGWFTNANLKDGKMTEITAETIGDYKFYARWKDSTVVMDTYEIKYELNGGTLPTDAPMTYVEETGAQLKAAEKTGYKFVGWYSDEACTNKVESISKESKGTVTLYASYEVVDYKVELEAGEGMLPTEATYVGDYEDYQAMVKDFVVDFNTQAKKTVAANGSDFFARSYMGDGSSAGYKFLTSADYSAKWGWMLTLINEVRAANDKSALKADDNQAEARGEIHNLLNQCGNGEKGGNASFGCDYTSEEVYGKVWEYVTKVTAVQTPIKSVTYNVEMLPFELPKPTAPEGKRFVGWYANAEFTGEEMNVLPLGTTGNLKVYAKYVSLSETIKFEINYELDGGLLSNDAPTEYVAGTTLAINVTPSKLGSKFVGWYLDAQFTKEVTEISDTQIGEVTLYAKWELVNYTIKFENAEGLTEQVMNYGDQLPTPVMEGLLFCGWFDNPECVGTKVTTVVGDATYYALWQYIVETFDHSDVEIIVDETGNGDYKTLDEAIKAANDYTVIKVADGNYTLGTVIDKSVTIKGNGANKTIVTMTKDMGNTLAAETIIIDGVALKGSGGANNGGLYFQPNAKAHIFTIKNCIISDMNTFFKSLNAVTNPMIITLENNEFTKVGQFIMWITNGVKTVNLIGNTINAGNCGTITNSAAALFRTRTAAMNVYGNTFTGTTPAIDGIFEASVDCTGIDVKYNTFANVGKYVHINSKGNPIVFDENLYLDAEGAVLTTTPTTVAKDGVTVDKTVATSAEDVANKYAAKTTESTIKFNVGNGTIQDNFAEFRKYDGYSAMLPVAKLYDHYFLGWCLNEDLSDAPTMVLVGEQAEEVTLYAKFKQIPNWKITYETNGGTLGENPVVVCKDGTTVEITTTVTKEESFFAGWFANAECTGNPVTKVSATENVTLYAKWVPYQYANIEYVLNDGTLPADAPTRYILTIGLTLPTPTKAGYKFIGWYENADFLGESISEITDKATNDYKLYALWQNVSSNYKVTYMLNGGNTIWQTRDALVTDFLADYGAYMNKKFTKEKFFDASYGPTATQINGFFTSEKYTAKWGWMKEYFDKILETNKPADFASDAAQIRGMIHNFLNANESSIYGVNFESFALADGFWDLIQTKLVDEIGHNVVTPSRPYYTFEGWYDNAECTGNPVKAITGDCTLYAKWTKNEYTLTYVVNNDEATMTATTVKFDPSMSFKLETPTADEKYWKFIGWFVDEECTNGIQTLAAYTQSNLTVYAAWYEIDGFTIKYELNGGNFITPSDEEFAKIKADFLEDYKKFYSAGEFNVWLGGNAGVMEKTMDMFRKTNHKWDWLLDYWTAVNTNSYNKVKNGDAFQQLKTKGTLPDYYFLSVEMKSWYTDTQSSVYSGGLKAANYTDAAVRNQIWEFYAAAEQTEFINNKGTVTLLVPNMRNYDFDGWYRNPELTDGPYTTTDTEGTFYAKWKEGTPVESITINNIPENKEMKRFDTLQLNWTLNPTNANIQDVEFSSSDPTVATISKTGLITAITNGTTVIKVKSLSASAKYDEFTLTVYTPDHFDISYETESYTTVGNTIKLLAQYIKKDNTSAELTWTSANPTIATVDNTGAVTGVSAGQATITVSVVGDENAKQDFIVTILDKEISSELQYLLDAHNSNVFVKYELGIGAGTPAYYKDIIGSVSQVLFNDKLTISDKYLAQGNANTSNHSGKRPSTQFITVHYTGNMSSGADAAANANYFVGTDASSIHFTTGNDGVYQCMDLDLIAWHAGDGASSPFEWTATGVMYNENDPTWPTFGISKNAKFEINGKETVIPLPDYDKGHPNTAPDKVAGTGDRWINDMGLAWKVENGQYYLGTTWWCYSQIGEGRICSKGGNRYSIGIESCVDKGSDLWFTWQRTAQLVAKLMLDWDLDITRVKGHHFYTAKDCPQPLLENDLEIWWIFLDMVEHEYELLTTYKDSTVTFKSNSTVVDNHGRVTEQPLFSQIVTYTVSLNGKEITLATCVEGMYNKDCGC